jgi:hypothetical protein
LSIIGIDKPTASERRNYGCRIHTAEPGSRSVTLIDGADACRFLPGRYACILSFN